MPKSKRRNPDHARKHQYPGLDNEVIAADLEALLTPALYAQQAYIRQLGLRNRILNLSLMLAAVSSAIGGEMSNRTETCAKAGSHSRQSFWQEHFTSRLYSYLF